MYIDLHAWESTSGYSRGWCKSQSATRFLSTSCAILLVSIPLSGAARCSNSTLVILQLSSNQLDSRSYLQAKYDCLAGATIDCGTVRLSCPCDFGSAKGRACQTLDFRGHYVVSFSILLTSFEHLHPSVAVCPQHRLKYERVQANSTSTHAR